MPDVGDSSFGWVIAEQRRIPDVGDHTPQRIPPDGRLDGHAMIARMSLRSPIASLSRCAALLVALGLGAAGSSAWAQVYKCQKDGRTVYADAPCSRGAATLKLPNEGAGSATGRTVCDQLADERQRLAMEAERAAHSGGRESAAHAGRRERLARQYESRCVGIRRSAEAPK